MYIVGQWAGHYYDPAENSDKIWAAAYTDTGEYLAVWGRRDNRKYQSQHKHFTSSWAAHTELEKLIKQKKGKGYRQVSFEDPSHGNIPSFQTSVESLGATPTTTPAKITLASVISQIKKLSGQIKRHFEPDTQLVEYQQLKAIAQIFFDNYEGTGPG
jgi:predicted DNA-binding WGR domain protein